MKKTIVALAVALTSLAASAQVSINGVIGYGASVANSKATVGMHDTKIMLTASEKIGTMTATAVAGLNGIARDSAVIGQDAYVSLAGKFGEVRAGQVELVNGIMGRGNVNAPVIGADGVVLAAFVNKQLISYTTPTMSGLRASVSATQDVNGVGTHAYNVGASYDVGPLSAGIDYQDTSKRVRTSVSYNMSGIKVGAGWSGNETGVANSYTLGASTPVGPLLMGAAYSKGDGQAMEAGVAYPMSKRTVFSVAYRNVADNSVAANNVGTYRVRLTHTF